MGRSKLLVVLLALGTVGGFASGIRSVARYQYYKHHGGSGQECGSWGGRGYGHNSGWNRQPAQAAVAPAPVVVEKIVEKRVEVPAPTVSPTLVPTAAPTVNIYVNPTSAQTPTNTPTGDTQTR